MTSLYIFGGGALIIAGLLWYIRYLTREVKSIGIQLDVLEAKNEHSKEVIQHLLDRSTVDSTIDSLLEGGF